MALVITHNAIEDKFDLTTNGVTISLPYTPAAMKVLRSILMSHSDLSKIGSPGNPTQAQATEELDKQVKDFLSKKWIEVTVEIEL